MDGMVRRLDTVAMVNGKNEKFNQNRSAAYAYVFDGIRPGKVR